MICENIKDYQLKVKKKSFFFYKKKLFQQGIF